MYTINWRNMKKGEVWKKAVLTAQGALLQVTIAEIIGATWVFAVR